MEFIKITTSAAFAYIATFITSKMALAFVVNNLIDSFIYDIYFYPKFLFISQIELSI